MKMGLNARASRCQRSEYTSLVYENPDSRFAFEKTMFGAYILFPYAEEEVYKNHRFYRSIGSVNIGGLPFLPSAVYTDFSGYRNIQKGWPKL